MEQIIMAVLACLDVGGAVVLAIFGKMGLALVWFIVWTLILVSYAISIPTTS